MEYATNITNNLTSNMNGIYSWFYKDENIDCIKNLSDNQILNIATDINSLFSETNLIESNPELSLPRLVVVGTQSSGKSSVLNSIMSMDILPTGQNMVTRTPLDIRLYQLDRNSKYKEGWIEFGYYNNEGYITEEKITITIPKPTNEEVEKVLTYIKKKTSELAGNGMNISSSPIILKIYSPFVPNLSLMDLPGLTMVACTDKGQPEDIKDRIEEMISNYIKQERTIILAVMQSRSDLETDLGLALVKKYDPKGDRTIGILTKPDLMNHDTHVGDYLVNNISKNLMLRLGYYVVKNRNNQEMKEIDMQKGLEKEKMYFMNHPEYKKSIYRDRIGITNLTSNVSKILINSIADMIPSVMTEIFALETKINKKLDSMGQEIPISKEGKISIINRYVTNFSSRFIDSIESRGKILNTGKTIKDIFVNFRTNLSNICPFLDETIYDDSYFNNIKSSFEGNHMSFYTPPIQILEACMNDEKYKPIINLKDLSLKCVDDICNALIDLIKNLGSEDEFSQFPPLANFITAIVVDEIVSPQKMNTKQHIIEFLNYEENYIWTDDKEFYKVLTEISKESDFSSESIRSLLESYFSAVKKTVSHNIPKIIMTIIVRNIEKSLLTFLFQKVVTENNINLLKEDEGIEKQRKYYLDLKSRIEAIKKVFPKAI